MTKQNVISVYRSIGSIKGTARETNMSEQTVRKILLEAGEYTSERAQKISTMADDGMDAGEIAAELGISKTTVLSYLPYSKGGYKVGEKSKNALAIKRCREKKKL